MKSRIAVCVLSFFVAVFSLSLGGCSKGREETSEPPSEGSRIEETESPSKPEESSDNAASALESVPTIFVGADDKPVYDNEVTKVLGSDKKPADLTASDENVYVFCDGFQYLKEPAGVSFNNLDNPELFEEWEFKGETPENKNQWRRVNVGEEICGLKLKKAQVVFNARKSDGEMNQTYLSCVGYIARDDTSENLGFDFELEGEITIKGLLDISARNQYEPDGGALHFTPVEDKLPLMPDPYYKSHSTYEERGTWQWHDFRYWGETAQMQLTNPDDVYLGGLGNGDAALVEVTIKDPNYHGGYSAQLVDIEVLSDVLYHTKDTV